VSGQSDPTQPGSELEPYADKCARHHRKGGGICRHPAGFRTDHPGIGPCYLHGGRTPVKHGRYSKIRPLQLRKLIQAHEEDPDPLNLLPELALGRALFEDFLKRAKEAGNSLDAVAAMGLLEAIARIVKRIEDIRSQDAISRPELIRVVTEMGRNTDHRLGQFARRVEELLPRDKVGHLEELLNQTREDLKDDWVRISIA